MWTDHGVPKDTRRKQDSVKGDCTLEQTHDVRKRITVASVRVLRRQQKKRYKDTVSGANSTTGDYVTVGTPRSIRSAHWERQGVGNTQTRIFWG